MIIKKTLLGMLSSILVVGPSSALLNQNLATNSSISEFAVINRDDDIRNQKRLRPVMNAKWEMNYGIYINNHGDEDGFGGEDIEYFYEDVEYDVWYTYAVGELKINYGLYAADPFEFLTTYNKIKYSSLIMDNFWDARNGWHRVKGTSRPVSQQRVDKEFSLAPLAEETTVQALNDRSHYMYANTSNSGNETNRIAVYEYWNTDAKTLTFEFEVGVKISPYQDNRLSGAILKVARPEIYFMR